MDAAKNKDWDLVGTRSIQLILSLMSLHQNCFTGETLVATEDGQKRIDEIEVGDKVWAYDIFTGETELKEVLTVYVHDVDEILHLHTSCGDIDTTTNHPFFVIDRGWVAAGDLVEGDEVYLIDGSTAVITGSELEQLSETIKVYNLEVADFNTYFVGDEAVLVHNYKKGDKLPDPNELANSDWQDVTHSQQAKNTNSREYYNAASDTKIRFDPAKPGAPGFEGQDHYHIYNPNSTGKGDFYLEPVDTISAT